MSNRTMIDENSLEEIVGGNITYTWRNGTGTCGLNGNNTYTFSDKTAFLNAVKQYYTKGMSDQELLNKLIGAGVIH